MDENIAALKTYRRAESNLRDKLKAPFLKQYSHYLMPGVNLNSLSLADEWEIEDTVAQYQEYPYHCDLPRPLLPPARLPRTVIEDEDPVLELVTLKRHMNDDIERLKRYHGKHKKELQASLKETIEWRKNENTMKQIIPKFVASIAEIIDKDPDPYFKGV